MTIRVWAYYKRGHKIICTCLHQASFSNVAKFGSWARKRQYLIWWSAGFLQEAKMYMLARSRPVIITAVWDSFKLGLSISYHLQVGLWGAVEISILSLVSLLHRWFLNQWLSYSSKWYLNCPDERESSGPTVIILLVDYCFCFATPEITNVPFNTACTAS